MLLLKVETPIGPGWHRYNGDGYGEHTDGAAFDGTGTAAVVAVSSPANVPILSWPQDDARRRHGSRTRWQPVPSRVEG